jgi:hypothetical protein
VLVIYPHEIGLRRLQAHRAATRQIRNYITGMFIGGLAVVVAGAELLHWSSETVVLVLVFYGVGAALGNQIGIKEGRQTERR